MYCLAPHSYEGPPPMPPTKLVTVSLPITKWPCQSGAPVGAAPPTRSHLRLHYVIGGVASIVFGPIRWCVWSFRPSSPLQLPHLKFLFVCLCGRCMLQGLCNKCPATFKRRRHLNPCPHTQCCTKLLINKAIHNAMHTSVPNTVPPGSTSTEGCRIHTCKCTEIAKE